MIFSDIIGSVPVNTDLPSLQEGFYHIWPIYVPITAITFNSIADYDIDNCEHWWDYIAICLYHNCAK